MSVGVQMLKGYSTILSGTKLAPLSASKYIYIVSPTRGRGRLLRGRLLLLYIPNIDISMQDAGHIVEMVMNYPVGLGIVAREKARSGAPGS